ncbi:MAG: hypothetical protein K1X88_18585 [Nannocystaceae bacterium]|nr:hypothetical protein [Nannocystaceae bacterium]
MKTSPLAAARVAVLPMMWVVLAILMARDWWHDPYPPAHAMQDAYGHNHEAALTKGLLISFVELVAVLAILRPWSYQRSWGRALLALALLLPWLLIWTVLTMHAGGVFVLHWLWLGALVLVVGGMMFVSLFASYARVGAQRPD